ncbi:MAG: transposase, partial [Candidatus Tisiphia sp.]
MRKTQITDNGNYEKTLIDSEGRKLIEEVPSDRDGEFDPQLIPKGVRKFEGFEDKVISLYDRGM